MSTYSKISLLGSAALVVHRESGDVFRVLCYIEDSDELMCLNETDGDEFSISGDEALSDYRVFVSVEKAVGDVEE